MNARAASLRSLLPEGPWRLSEAEDGTVIAGPEDAPVPVAVAGCPEDPVGAREVAIAVVVTAVPAMLHLLDGIRRAARGDAGAPTPAEVSRAALAILASVEVPL